MPKQNGNKEITCFVKFRVLLVSLVHYQCSATQQKMCHCQFCMATCTQTFEIEMVAETDIVEKKHTEK